MALIFPNKSRSFNSAKNCVRFVGHDSMFQVTFCLEVGALKKIDKQMVSTEQGYFDAFDAARDAIELIAHKAYHRAKNSMIVLTASDIR